MELVKRVGKKQRSVPSNYKLSTLYQFVTGNTITNAHRAYGDVKATCAVFKHETFWKERKESIVELDLNTTTEQVEQTNNNNSDCSSCSDSDTDVEREDSCDEEQPTVAGDKWIIGKHFGGVDAERKFNEVFAS